MKADPLRIALLEYELLYIQPEPDTPEEAAVLAAIKDGELKRHNRCGGCQRAFRPHEEWCPDCTDCPEHGNDCSHPLPWDRFDCVNYRMRSKS